MGENLAEIPDDHPGRGQTIGGCVYYDSPPAVIEAACAAFWDALGCDGDWDAIPVWMKDEHRTRMKAALRAAINTTCSRNLTQAEGER